MGIRACAGLIVWVFVAVLVAGCGSVRKNVTYTPIEPGGSRLVKGVNGMVLPVADQRQDARIYPKQIIMHTSYSGDKSFDINDRPVDEVFAEAFSLELYRMGIGLTKPERMEGPLDKSTMDSVRREIQENYPEVKVAFGLKVTDFIARTQRKLATTDVKVAVAVELSILDVETGDLHWADYRTEWEDTVVSADRNYLVDQLDKALAEIMKRAVRDNTTLRDVLAELANR